MRKLLIFTLLILSSPISLAQNKSEIKKFMDELTYDLSKFTSKIDMFKAMKKEKSLTKVVSEFDYGFKADILSNPIIDLDEKALENIIITYFTDGKLNELRIASVRQNGLSQVSLLIELLKSMNATHKSKVVDKSKSHYAESFSLDGEISFCVIEYYLFEENNPNWGYDNTYGMVIHYFPKALE